MRLPQKPGAPMELLAFPPGAFGNPSDGLPAPPEPPPESPPLPIFNGSGLSPVNSPGLTTGVPVTRSGSAGGGGGGGAGASVGTSGRGGTGPGTSGSAGVS